MTPSGTLFYYVSSYFNSVWESPHHTKIELPTAYKVLLYLFLY